MTQSRSMVLVALCLATLACQPSRQQPPPNSRSGTDAGESEGSQEPTCAAGDESCEAGEEPTSPGDDGGQSSTSEVREVTLGQLRNEKTCRPYRVKGVVVTAVDRVYQGDKGDYETQFWVADPANPTHGIYVDKFFTDLPKAWKPTVGDRIDIEGWLTSYSRHEERVGYRLVFRSEYSCVRSNARPMVITPQGTMAPLADNAVSPGFGNAEKGKAKANPEYAATRVHIPGPLELTDAKPAAFKRITNYKNDQLYYGFEVSGGVLVNDYKTYDVRLADGGTDVRCDWRAVVTDGGSVVFEDGISGVWDTYTHAPCYDGGGSCSYGRDAGIVPGTGSNFTFVLYPQGCEDLKATVSVPSSEGEPE